MALTNDGQGITASYIKNSLKNLGIQEGSFVFYDLEKTARLFGERPLGALGIFSVLFLLCLPWGDIPSLADLKERPFELKLEPLLSFDTPSRFLFYAALGFMVLFFVLFLREQRRFYLVPFH